MSIGKLAPGQQAYYLDTVAGGAEEYYTDPHEAPGRWIGTSAALLGLEGTVEASVLGAILEGKDPRSRNRLTRGQGASRVAGFDATFSAPKSVSLLHALGSREQAEIISAAHRTAVDRALQVLEDHAAAARRGKHGLERVRGSGFVAAAFDHRSSRAGDPQLHTHVVIANLVHAVTDDRWSALDARPLYTWAKTAGTLYEAQLRAELTRRFGIEWGPVHNGIADIAGISKVVLRAFSRRRAEIEAHLQEVGKGSARAAQVAAYATRAAKDPTVDTSAPVEEWRTRAANLGFGPKDVDRLVDRVARRLEPPDRARLFADLADPTGLTAQHASFGRRDVLRAIADSCQQGLEVAIIEVLADAFFDSPNVVPLQRPGIVRDCDVIRRRDGTVVRARREEPRWTTTEIVGLEAGIIRSAATRQRADAGIADAVSVRAALDAHPTLSKEQVRMVRGVTTSGAGIEIVEGVAGAGKTHALAAARDAWEASGHTVVGCALAARAAAGLETEARIPSQTIRRFLHQLDRAGGPGLTERTVVVVDEAAMVGTRDLARLVERAGAANAKLVLVGDPRRLPAIEAGGVFAGLASRLGVARLQGNRRQHQAWERRALARLRNSSVDRAIADYERHGRVHVVGDRKTAHEQMADRWFDRRSADRDVVMLAGRVRDVEALNRAARARLRGSGMLGANEVAAGGRSFAVGDCVVARRNDYGIGILNGARATVTGVDPSKRTVDIRTEHGVDLAIPPSYLQGGNLDHGYAMTIHKAQGATFDHALVLADETLDRERGYTGLSRGREANELYLVDLEHGRDPHAPEMTPEPQDALAANLKTSSADLMALDQHLDLADELGLGL